MNNMNENNGWFEPPPYLEIPVDEDDPRFSKSFDLDDGQENFAEELSAAKEFFDTFGFCIFRNAASQEQCQALLGDMLALMKERHPEVDLADSQTWATALTHFGCPKKVNSLFRPSLLRLRQSAIIHRAFSTAMGITESEDGGLIVNHDRWLLHRPPATPSAPLTKRNIHLDMNPWEYQDDASQSAVVERLSKLQYSKSDRAYIAENNDVHKSMGTCLQAILNLNDVTDRSEGGTILIPGFHKCFASWLEHCAGEKNKGPMQYVLPQDDPLSFLAQHPTLRAGSLLVWDQRVFHGSTPNLSDKTRAAIPIKAFSASVLRQDKRRAKERAAAIRQQIRKAGFDDELTDLGREVFGLNLVR